MYNEDVICLLIRNKYRSPAASGQRAQPLQAAFVYTEEMLAGALTPRSYNMIS